jgi:hypothetical protein
MRELRQFFRANPQVLVLLLICLVLGIGTFIVVVFGIASSGPGRVTGEPSGAIWPTREVGAAAGRVTGEPSGAIRLAREVGAAAGHVQGEPTGAIRLAREIGAAASA